MVDREEGHIAEHEGSFSTSHCTDPERLQREKAMFRRMPLLLAHVSEIANPGDYVVRELDGRSWLLVRGDDGVARAFLNYCQHRGTKLEQASQGCKKRFSCPYHAWTYNVRGDLIGVPRADFFPKLDKSQKGLKQGDLQEEFGFLWLTQDAQAAQPLREFMGDLSLEYDALSLADHHVYFDKTREVKTNWKLPLTAFLESYHISTLHKQSIADFFLENMAHSERHGPHFRALVPRRKVVELKGANLDQINMSEYATPTNILFPNICTIAHPTSYSIICVFPGESPGRSLWRHILLVENPPANDKERAHFDKTVKVLDGMTYKNEDFWVSEQMQEGVNAGALDEMMLGRNEALLGDFIETVDSYLA